MAREACGLLADPRQDGKMEVRQPFLCGRCSVIGKSMHGLSSIIAARQSASSTAPRIGARACGSLHGVADLQSRTR